MWKTFYYGVCYYPEHWPPARHATDIARMADCGFNVIRLGEGAWSYWEPEQGQFQFEIFDRVIDLCHKHRIKVVMGTPTYAAPAWLSHAHPEVLRWNFERIPMAHGSRRNLTYHSPKYIELSDRICTALAEHYRNEKQIIAWQLDNEFNCHMDVSYSPVDTLAFRIWLKRKYKTLERLNAAWGTAFWSQTYSDWDQIDLPHPTAAPLNPTTLLDESRFISDGVVNFAKRQAAILRKHNSQWLITHNGLFGNVDAPKLTAQLDFFSHDQYPLFHNDWTEPAWNLHQARSLSFPFGILEQQSGPGGQMSYLQRTPRPGEMRLWAWQSIAHGAKLLSYFRWRTCPFGSEQHWHGLLDANDRDNRRIAEAKQVGKEIARIPSAFFDARPAKLTAVLRDFDNEINDRRINTYIITGQKESERWSAELGRRHIPCDQVWPDSNFSDYRLLIAPHLKIVNKALAETFARFVRDGGTLVLAAQSGVKDENCHIVEKTPPGLLAKLAGAEVQDWSMLGKNEFREARLATGELIALTTFVERLSPKHAQTIGTWVGSDLLLGEAPAVTRNRVGKGTVFYIGGYCSSTTVSRLATFLIDQLQIAPSVDADPDVEVMERVSSKKRYLFVMNHAAQQRRVRGLPMGKECLGNTKMADTELDLEPFEVA